MKRSLTVALPLTAAVAVALAGPAAAKGPTGVTITGPGLAEPIVLRGNAEGSVTSRIGRIVQFGGWFPQAFGQIPDSTTRQAPTRKLGPRYIAVWIVPVGDGRSVTIRQDLYPWATGGPVTHMRAGQRLFDAGTHGGWYRGPFALRTTLAALGVPRPGARPA
jgi:hypothetical protein